MALDRVDITQYAKKEKKDIANLMRTAIRIHLQSLNDLNPKEMAALVTLITSKADDIEMTMAKSILSNEIKWFASIMGATGVSTSLKKLQVESLHALDEKESQSFVSVVGANRSVKELVIVVDKRDLSNEQIAITLKRINEILKKTDLVSLRIVGASFDTRYELPENQKKQLSEFCDSLIANENLLKVEFINCKFGNPTVLCDNLKKLSKLHTLVVQDCDYNQFEFQKAIADSKITTACLSQTSSDVSYLQVHDPLSFLQGICANKNLTHLDLSGNSLRASDFQPFFLLRDYLKETQVLREMAFTVFDDQCSQFILDGMGLNQSIQTLRIAGFIMFSDLTTTMINCLIRCIERNKTIETLALPLKFVTSCDNFAFTSLLRTVESSHVTLLDVEYDKSKKPNSATQERIRQLQECIDKKLKDKQFKAKEAKAGDSATTPPDEFAFLASSMNKVFNAGERPTEAKSEVSSENRQTAEGANFDDFDPFGLAPKSTKSSLRVAWAIAQGLLLFVEENPWATALKAINIFLNPFDDLIKRWLLTKIYRRFSNKCLTIQRQFQTVVSRLDVDAKTLSICSSKNFLVLIFPYARAS